MSVAIQTMGLGKEYLIDHESSQGSDMLRESLSSIPRRLFRKSARFTKERFWALRDVDLEIHQGDRVGLIGGNGAGKSTLLKLLSRVTEPSVGEFRIRGRVANLLEVGAGFHPELTGRENIFLNGVIRGMSKKEIQSRFDEIVAFAETEKFLDTPVKRYSSGMYTRLAFAVASHLDSEILIVDEVLAVGDVAFQDKCLHRMSELNESGRTLLFVSQNMETVSRLCPKGIFLRRGRVAAVGAIDQVVAAYSEYQRSAGL